jgi:hypothetical protein
MARNFIPEAILLAMMIGGVLGLFLGWSQWTGKIDSLPAPPWRIVVARISLFAVTLQAAIFVALWTPLLSDRSASACIPIEFVLLLIGIPCASLGKTQYRWWLSASSAFWPIGTFFLVLARIAY